MSQILLLEALIKLVFGTPLVLAPLATLKLCGLPCPPTGFWPRIAGGLLLGLAAAIFIELRVPGANGLGLHGLIAINLFGAAMIAGPMIMNAGATTLRGCVALWLVTALLFILALAEISEI